MIRRATVIWVGAAPGSEVETEFKNRDLVLKFQAYGDVATTLLAQSRGIVYRFSPSTLTPTRETFVRTWAQATDHGLSLYLMADNDTIQGHVDSLLVGVKCVCRRRTAPAAHEVAETMARHDPGPEYRDRLEIQLEGELAPLSATEALLLKRAFSDCCRVSLRRLTGGRSARVFAAYATFQDSRVGPRPLPFFVKYDEPDKVAEERRKYQEFAAHFIPFNLRPNLDMERCLIGSELGVLVGNLVERSESLWEVVRRGQAQSAIYSLFDCGANLIMSDFFKENG